MIVLYVLGYLWSFLTTVPGLLLLLLAKVTGAATSVTTYGPAIVVQIRGRWANWMQTPNAAGTTWFGHTVGPVIFLYRWVSMEELDHEQRHVFQQLVLGPFHLIIYAASWLYGLVRYRDTFLAYHNCVLERDARRASGEE